MPEPYLITAANDDAAIARLVDEECLGLVDGINST